MKKPIWIITQKRLSSTQGSAMISPNSFCGFVFTRPIDMILDPPFLQNPLDKNEETNLNYYSETVEFHTRFRSDISQLILWICFTRAINMILDPPFLQNLLNKNEETNLKYYSDSEMVEFYTRFCNDISQIILWICLHKAHRYDFRPAIPAESFGQKRRNQFELLPRNGWVLHKVLQWYLPTHSVDLSSQGP